MPAAIDYVVHHAVDTEASYLPHHVDAAGEASYLSHSYPVVAAPYSPLRLSRNICYLFVDCDYTL